ncbi:RecX family transcriptional regulator [Marinomonas sp. 2405UD68-3]|uniref:RecX family transcriptional regulator n=1 Tax=Marinomonas sp. 2405UD68-3 TaxID=3391835 RepID=UPI0039C9138D
MQRPSLQQAKSIDNVFNSAYWHLNQQDFTILEIRKKLERKTQNVDWIENVLARLIEHNYLKSDLEFAIRYCESAFNNETGKGAIVQKLKKRGISSQNIDTAIAQVIKQNSIDFYEMASSRLQSRYSNFEGISKEKLYAQMTVRGFSRAQIDYALSQHPAQDSLRSKVVIKAEKAELSNEIIKLHRKGKGKTLILRELKQRLIDVSKFDETLYQLELVGDIDFYKNCKEQLGKKQFNLSNYKEKSKAYAYLSLKGFSSDEIKEAMSSDAD